MTTNFITRATTKQQHKLCQSKTFMSHFQTHFPKNTNDAALDECPISLVSNLSL